MARSMGLLTRMLATAVVTVMLATPALAWAGDESVGVVDQTSGLWYLKDAGNGQTTSFYYGNPGDFPIMGDWDCDGVDTPGLYRQSDGFVYLRNLNTQGIADIRFFFGNPGDIPLAGDFNGNGCDTVSIYRPSDARIFVINELGANDGGLGAADFDFYFGDPGDKPFTGDFNNNRQDTVGLHRESTGFVYYRNTLTTGIADNDFFYGDPGDQIITGRWTQNPNTGPDTVGIFRPSQGNFYLRFSNTQGNADVDFPYGNSDMAAVSGRFGALPGGDPAPPEPTIPGLVQKGSGIGDNVVVLNLPNEPVVIEMSHTGTSNFAVWSIDATSGKIDLLVNEIGSYTGTRAMQFDSSEPVAALEIIADGNWTYEIRTLATEPSTVCPTNGSGDSVIILDNFKGRGGSADIVHTGSSNFYIWTWSGNDRDLLVNEIGPYAGTRLVTFGHSVWEIGADGTWSVNC